MPRGSQPGCTARKGPQGNVVRCSRALTPRGARLASSLRAGGGGEAPAPRACEREPRAAWRQTEGDATSPPAIAAQCAAPARLRLAEPEPPSRVVPATLRLAFLASLARHPPRGDVGPC